MKIFYPLYYKEFKCIADKCRHSCCVGWEISVDRETMGRYEKLGRADILCHINDNEITLGPDGRCPFLRDDGLCRLICLFGDNYTSEICREHPRFYNRIGERVECGIGASCEEAARIILSSDGYSEFFYKEGECEPAEETDFNTVTCREEIFSILKCEELSFSEKISKIRLTHNLPFDIHSKEEWREIFTHLEYLDEAHRDVFIFRNLHPALENEKKLERFLAYLVFRHVSVATSYDNLRARLGFCLLLTDLLCGYAEEAGADLSEYARIISEEIEYSEDNTSSLIFEFECCLE